MSRITTTVGGVAVVGIAAIAGLYMYGGRAGGDCGGVLVAGGAIGGPFTLLDSTGKSVTDKDVITEPSIVYFGYTFCPDVCPLDSARNAAAVDILADRGYSVTPIFISIDPERDTPEVVGAYAKNFHPKMIGLTGSAEQVKAAANAYRVIYSRQDDDPDYYLMSHTVFSYLMTPKNGFLEVFRREDSPEQMADRVACQLDAT
jgi:protein SCO1/2